MSPMRLIILAVAAIAAVAAAFLVRGMAANQPATVTTAEPVVIEKRVEMSQIKVLTARADLPIGTLLTPEDFSWADWPEKTVNPGYFTQENNSEAMEELTGSVVRITTYADEPILPQKVVRKGETGFMAALLRPGFRAVSVEISPESASAGFILPDDRVDVILSYEVEVTTSQSVTERPVTETILQNVRILAIDQMFGEVDGVPALTGSTATMELTQLQAEQLALAGRMGAISLTLRSFADTEFNEGVAYSDPELFEKGNQQSGGGIRIFRNGNSAAGGSL